MISYDHSNFRYCSFINGELVPSISYMDDSSCFRSSNAYYQAVFVQAFDTTPVVSTNRRYQHMFQSINPNIEKPEELVSSFDVSAQDMNVYIQACNSVNV